MRSIIDVLKDAYMKWQNEPFIYYKENNEFIPCSFKDFIESIIFFAKGLNELGLNNNKFMIYSGNSLEYLICDTAITGIVGTTINVDKKYKAYDLGNAITKCSPNVLFYSKKQENIINNIREKYPNISYLELEKQLQKIIKIGKNKQGELFDVKDKNPNTCSKIIFSSGSTNMPKAVMLSQENLISGYDCVSSRIPLNDKQREYLFLPLSHIFATCSYYYSLICGKKIYLAEDIKNITEELQQVKPNFMITVPIICEKLSKSVNRNRELLKDLLGGNINYMLIGGTKVSNKLKEEYHKMGIDLKECYGMTEMATVLAGGLIDDNDTDSTGVLYSQYEYKIVDKDEYGIGELLVRKKDSFLGYYNDPETTQKSLDKDGFYHTGDLGKIINNKFYFERRKDRIILLPNGEKINPVELENLIKEKCAVAKVTIHLDDKRLKAILYSDIVKNYDGEISDINDDLPSYKQIDSYELKSNSERIK